MTAQIELAMSRPPTPSTMPIEFIRACKSAGRAFSMALEVSTLDEKEVYVPLGIDAGTFSKICSGKATLPAEKIADFCALVGNTIYPEWIAYQVGCTLVMVKSEAERQRDEALEALTKERLRTETLLQALRGGK